MGYANLGYCPAKERAVATGSMQLFTLRAVHDERHLLLERPAMQTVRDRYPTLFSPAQGSMQLFMSQADHDIVGVFMDCFDHLGAAPDDPDDGYSDSDSSSSALAVGLKWSFIHSSMWPPDIVTQTQTQLHQPWRLDRCKDSFIHCGGRRILSWIVLTFLGHACAAPDAHACDAHMMMVRVLRLIFISPGGWIGEIIQSYVHSIRMCTSHRGGSVLGH